MGAAASFSVLAPQELPSRLSRGREACSPQRLHMAWCAGFWAERVAEGGSHLTRTILASLPSWWPGGAWSPWGLPNWGPPRTQGSSAGQCPEGSGLAEPGG